MLIVNTCAFIDKAKQESIDAILEMAELKKTGACKRLVVTGCLAERYRDELKDQIPEIDALLGTGEVPEIVAALGDRASARTPYGPQRGQARRCQCPMTLHPEARPGTSRSARRAELPTYIYDADTPRRLATPGHYAYVKVAEGCDYTCAFCIIPRLRGHYRSRPADEIVREARHLAGRGVKELLLISQDTTFYGNDLRRARRTGPPAPRAERVDGLEWIRLLYLYPTTIDDDDARGDGRAPTRCASTSTCRCSTPRMPC